LGISNVTAAQLQKPLALQRAQGLAPFRFVQNNHNFAVRGFDADLIALCRTHDIATISYSPLGAGFLTGKHREGVAPGSRFEIIPGHQGVYLNPAAEQRFDELAKVAARHGVTTTQLALAWALRHPAISSTLIGGRAARHVDQAFDALNPDLTAALADLGQPLPS